MGPMDEDRLGLDLAGPPADRLEDLVEELLGPIRCPAGIARIGLVPDRRRTGARLCFLLQFGWIVGWSRGCPS